MARHNEFVGPIICEELAKRLTPADRPNSGAYNYILPDGTECMIGVERVWAMTESKPAPVAIDLGGSMPFVLWR